MTALIKDIAQTMQRAGGRAFVVGGGVRDQILDIPLHDLDLEVFGLPIEKIEELLKGFGKVDQAGKQFAILLLQTGTEAIEVAAPRREIKTGAGHRGFSVEIDPHLSPTDAARRRDFTINAMMLDPLTNELLDPFHGQDDLKKKILRVVDEHTFVEDPLRVLRGIQLASRLELTVEPQTLALLKRMIGTIRELPKFRLEPEWTKLLLLARQPSRGLQLAQDIGYFTTVAPVFDQLAETAQNPQHHPEGDVWQHTLLTVDAAAQLVKQHHPDNKDRLVVMLAAWLHDIGKAVTTKERDGKLTSYGHDGAGAPLAKTWLLSQGFSDDISTAVSILVGQHMHLQQLETLQADGQLTDGALRRLVNRLGSVKPGLLLTVREADARGHGLAKADQAYPPRQWFLPRLQALGLDQGTVSLVRGQDLLNLGWQPDPVFGDIIAAAETYAEDHNATRQEVLEIITAAGSPAAAVRHLRPESL